MVYISWVMQIANLEAFFQILFSGQTGVLGGLCAHRQQHTDSTVLLQIQIGSLGNPPTPSVSDFSLELDSY